MAEDKRHVQLGLSDDDVIEMYKTMVLARKLDERMWLLNRAGKIPFVVSCQGQEAAQVGSAFALDRKKDYVAPYYRDVGVVLAFGMSAQDIMLSGFAKAEDPNSGGRQMPGHFSQKKNRIITGSSPVATQIPHAVGFALAAKLKKEEFVTLTALGDGSTNQGDFHEALNFAGVHKLPIITVVQNNRLAISVPYEKQVASETIAVRAKSYGMPGYVVDGNDPLAVYEVVTEARQRAMNNEGPTLIEAVTERLTAHSSDDNDRIYRSEAELQEAKKKDCILTFSTYLLENDILTEDGNKQINDELNEVVNKATEYAENADYADIKTLYDFVYEG